MIGWLDQQFLCFSLGSSWILEEVQITHIGFDEEWLVPISTSGIVSSCAAIGHTSDYRDHIVGSSYK
jgi:hypothetical protein